MIQILKRWLSGLCKSVRTVSFHLIGTSLLLWRWIVFSRNWLALAQVDGGSHCTWLRVLDEVLELVHEALWLARRWLLLLANYWVGARLQSLQALSKVGFLSGALLALGRSTHPCSQTIVLLFSLSSFNEVAIIRSRTAWAKHAFNHFVKLILRINFGRGANRLVLF